MTSISARSSTSTAASTAALCEFIVETSIDDLPPKVVTATKRVILDTIAVTIAASSTPMSQVLTATRREQGGNPQASLVVSGDRLPLASVAHVHAQLANLLDFDDTILECGHFGSTSVMTALAAAQLAGGSGAELIATVATSYELSARLGRALQQPLIQVPGQSAGIYGFSWLSFAAAAASGRLIGLTPDQLDRALGQTLVLSPATFDVAAEFNAVGRGMEMPWHRYQLSGPSAEAGVQAALLVGAGQVARRGVFDEGSEFWRSFHSVGFDREVMFGDLGRRWQITEAALKMEPFCRYGGVAVDLFTRLVEEHRLGPDDIVEVTVRIPPHIPLLQMMLLAVEITDPLEIFMSLPTAFALVALGVPAGPRWWDVDVTGSAVRDLAHRVRMQVQPAWGPMVQDQTRGAGLRRIPTEVLITTRTSTVSGFADWASGDPWADDFDRIEEQLSAKVHRCTEGLLSEQRTDELIRAVESLDHAPTVDAVVSSMCA